MKTYLNKISQLILFINFSWCWITTRAFWKYNFKQQICCQSVPHTCHMQHNRLCLLFSEQRAPAGYNPSQRSGLRGQTPGCCPWPQWGEEEVGTEEGVSSDAGGSALLLTCDAELWVMTTCANAAVIQSLVYLPCDFFFFATSCTVGGIQWLERSDLMCLHALQKRDDWKTLVDIESLGVLHM